MKTLTFVAQNWDDILVVLLLIAATITGIRQWLKVKGPIFAAMTTKRENSLCHAITHQSCSNCIGPCNGCGNSVRWKNRTT